MSVGTEETCTAQVVRSANENWIRSILNTAEQGERLIQLIDCAGVLGDERPESFTLVPLGCKPIVVRPGTSDARVLCETFLSDSGMYHLPPVVLRDDALILDIGANIGTTAADFGFRYPNATIVCVEIDPENAAMCRSNTAWMGDRCSVFEAAAWVESGEVKYGGTAFWSRRVRWVWDLPNENAEPEIGVRPAIAMRELVESTLRRTGRKSVDYIKMDIEGSEATILEGEVDWVSKVDAIRVHVHAPTTVQRTISRLSTGGMYARACWKHPSSVVGISKATALRTQRWPKDEKSLRPGPPPI